MACGLSRTSLPSASPGCLCWGPSPSARWGCSGCRLPTARLGVLPSEQPLHYGAECTVVVAAAGEPVQGYVCWGMEAGARRSLPCRDGSELGSVAAQAAPAWEAVPAAGSGAPACSGRSSLDSCNVSVACLSFHGVSILQPPSVLIPGGRGRGCLPWHRVVCAGIQAVLGMPEFYMQQQF